MIVTVTPNPVLDRTLIVPRIVWHEVIRATTTRLDWGGKGFNVSRALKALGMDSVAVGFIGGATGELLERGLRELGIATDFVRIAGETRTNVVIAEQDTGRYLKVNEAGPVVSAEEQAALLALVRRRVRPGELWVLSGSLPLGVPPAFYADLVVTVQQAGAQAFLDTSGEPLLLGCQAGPYLVKPNAVEAQEVTGQEIDDDDDALAAARFFLEQGVQVVALSLGAGGLVLASRGWAVRARPPQVEARNPVGAGDALLAGVAWAMLRGLTPEEIARWGVACGAAAAASEGVAFGSREEVEALYHQSSAYRCELW
ncbi:MAG: 1-phosphofructokinase [Anaerolineae bacterium]|nr:1-phosphofructokinase [Anaerolineae bacterium]